MPKAITLTDFGGPDVLRWADVPLPQPGEGQIRVKVKAAGVGPTDLALRSGRLKAFSLRRNAVLGFEAAGTVDAVGPGVNGTQIGEEVAALLFDLGGYAEYAVASMWVEKPPSVPWAAAASAGLGGGGSRGSAADGGEDGRHAADPRWWWGCRLDRNAVGCRSGHQSGECRRRAGRRTGHVPGCHARTLRRGVGGRGPECRGCRLRVRRVWQGVLADAIALTGAADRVITLSDPAAGDFGVRLSHPSPERAPHALEDTMSMLARGRLRLREYRTMRMRDASEAHRLLEGGQVHERVVLTL